MGTSGAKGSKAHAAVETLDLLLALVVTPASDDERTQVETLATQVETITEEHVELAWVDAGYTGLEVTDTAAAHGIQLAVVRLPEAKRGVALRLRR